MEKINVKRFKVRTAKTTELTITRKEVPANYLSSEDYVKNGYDFIEEICLNPANGYFIEGIIKYVKTHLLQEK